MVELAREKKGSSPSYPANFLRKIGSKPSRLVDKLLRLRIKLLGF